MKNRIKRIIHFLKVWDGVWSVPLALLFFLVIGWGITSIYGPEVGFMAPVYFQRLVYAALCLVVCNFVALYGIYMNFRGFFRYYQDDSCDDFKNLDPKYKLKIFMLVYFGYFLFFSVCLILV